jgi:DNA-binding response OmpR family regulator
MATILVIDDDPQMRRMIARTLSAKHHKVIEAKDGRDGLKQFRAHRPMLVITDLVMPGQEGIETIQELRREAPGVPILAISGGGSGFWSYLEAAKQLGAADALAKPFLGAELIEAVDHLLDRAKAVAAAIGVVA